MLLKIFIVFNKIYIIDLNNIQKINKFNIIYITHKILYVNYNKNFKFFRNNT
jgi:hypothetical protein